MEQGVRIVEYRLGWSPKRGQGGVWLKLADGRSSSIAVASLADLAGWAALCKESPLFLHPDGSIVTTEEPIV